MPEAVEMRPVAVAVTVATVTVMTEAVAEARTRRGILVVAEGRIGLKQCTTAESYQAAAEHAQELASSKTDAIS